MELIYLLYALELAVVGYVFSVVLIAEWGCFEWYGDLLERLKSKPINKCKGSETWWFIAYPLGYCEKCFTGQIALYFWAWQRLGKGDIISEIIYGIIFISCSVLFVILLKNIFNILKKYS